MMEYHPAPKWDRVAVRIKELILSQYPTIGKYCKAADIAQSTMGQVVKGKYNGGSYLSLELLWRIVTGIEPDDTTAAQMLAYDLIARAGILPSSEEITAAYQLARVEKELADLKTRQLEELRRLRSENKQLRDKLRDVRAARVAAPSAEQEAA